MNLSQFSATNVIIGASCLALLWALLQFLIVARIPVETAGSSSEESGLVSGNDENTTARLIEIYTAIYEGAESFLRAEYTVCALFVIAFTVVILLNN
jgi:Na+/H+-translocating membrane pyrophosphatase